MAGLRQKNEGIAQKKLNEFLEQWSLDKVKALTLSEYSDVGKKNTFCYSAEFGTEELGRITGKPSNKFGIWKRKKETELKSNQYLYDESYAWHKKYGDTAEKAFENIKSNIIRVIENSLSGNFEEVDSIDIDSLFKWKIAFIYSNYKLMPIYKKSAIKEIARRLEYDNVINANLPELHRHIVKQKPDNEDFFDFAWRQFDLLDSEQKKNYYVIGSKYQDENGNDSLDILPEMLERNVISTGFFWGVDFSDLYGEDYKKIYKWCDSKLQKDYPVKYDTAKRTLGYFLNLKPGDIIAVKSHGRYGNLTIVAYATVISVNGKVYEFDDADFPYGLGHIINVEFIESGLEVKTGLSYSRTIHQIIPKAREGHFEKIFGSFSVLDRQENDADIETENNEVKIYNRINEKQTEPSYRDVSYKTTISQTHNKLQVSFAKFLKSQFPSDTVMTEGYNIDIIRSNDNDVYLYEVKPFNSAYSCIRAGIGQLLDYCHSNSFNNKNVNLCIVGFMQPSDKDLLFIDFIKKNLNISFEYKAYDYEEA